MNDVFAYITKNNIDAMSVEGQKLQDDFTASQK